MNSSYADRVLQQAGASGDRLFFDASVMVSVIRCGAQRIKVSADYQQILVNGEIVARK